MIQNLNHDGLGTTHHEAGTLWMGIDPSCSVTNEDGRFHQVDNLYAAGPCLFPSIGIAQSDADWHCARSSLKLGFEVAQSTVSKYMVRRHGGPSGQSWWTFLRNHAPEIAAMDLFVVPTLAFKLLYGFIIVRLDRRELVHIAVTNSPTADWIARQITEAFPWDAAPGYPIRDRDCVLARS